MRVRVPVAVRNRLVRLEGRRPVDLPVGGWPPLMALDEWEVMAAQMQDDLSMSAREEILPKQELRPTNEAKFPRNVDVGHERRPSAVEEYLNAQQKARELRTLE